LEVDNVPAGFAPVNNLVAIGYPARMVGMDHGDSYISDRLRSSLIHWRNILCAFFLQPGAQFVNSYNHGVMPLSNFHGVADVIKVAVGAQQDINLFDILFGLRAHGIAHHPRIHKYDLAIRSFNSESCMS